MLQQCYLGQGPPEPFPPLPAEKAGQLNPFLRVPAAVLQCGRAARVSRATAGIGAGPWRGWAMAGLCPGPLVAGTPGPGGGWDSPTLYPRPQRAAVSGSRHQIDDESEGIHQPSPPPAPLVAVC